MRRVAASVLLAAAAVRAAPLEPCPKGDYDDPTWVYKHSPTSKEHHCGYIRDDPGERCDDVGSSADTAGRVNPVKASIACRAACGQCTGECQSGEVDDKDWRHIGTLGCDWVREDPDLRCSAQSSKATGAVKAQEACAAACARCAGVCKDSETWSTLHENGLPIGCEYLGRDVESLCASTGEGPSRGVEARDACPATCGKCVPPPPPMSQMRVQEPNGGDVRPSRLPYLVLLAGVLAFVAIFMGVKVRRKLMYSRPPARPYASVNTDADDDEFGGTSHAEMAPRSLATVAYV
mmetsp:Transcript_14576/g.43518  ORF Transcript_14576/g.43518 Transcript_14576/m.43518 type:complete len:292 (+) Transcript_14576:1293-2168(+)